VLSSVDSASFVSSLRTTTFELEIRICGLTRVAPSD
jgi:hypothetical protein